MKKLPAAGFMVGGVCGLFSGVLFALAAGRPEGTAALAAWAAGGALAGLVVGAWFGPA